MKKKKTNKPNECAVREMQCSVNWCVEVVCGYADNVEHRTPIAKTGNEQKTHDYLPNTRASSQSQSKHNADEVWVVVI